MLAAHGFPAEQAVPQTPDMALETQVAGPSAIPVKEPP